MVQPLTLSLATTFSAADPASDLPSKVRGVAYSGALVPDRGIIIDLASTRVELPAPLLYGHDHDSTVGLIASANNSGRELQIEGDLYVDIDEQARSIAAKAARGHPWQLSVGLFDYVFEERPAGREYQINGQTFAGPLIVLSGGVVREVSVVALGADAATNAEFFSFIGTRTESMSTTQNADTIAALTAERDAAQARVAELEWQVATLSATVAGMQQTARLSAVRALFSDLGREFSDAAAAPYVALSAESFDAIAADMRATRPTLPAHLTRPAAGNGDPATPPPNSLLAAVRAVAGRGAH